MPLLLPLVLLICLAIAAPAAAVTKKEVRVPMRDGVELAVDLYLPDGVERAPVILTLTPYHALYKGLGDGESMVQWRFLEQGYAVAMADVRGTYESGGCWDYGGLKERQDGHDLVEWLGTQPWSNGRVGMIGASYDGTTANAAAVEQPPHLATIVPISSISRWWGYAYTGGVRHAYSGATADIDPPSDTPADFMFAYGFAPPPEPGAATAAQQVAMRWTPCDRVAQTLHGYSTQPDYDDFWKERDYLRDAARVQVPVLVGHGELDFNVKTWEGTQWFDALPGEKAMVIGQWPHAIPVWDGWDDFLDRWFARWLKGEANGVENEPPVVSEANDRVFRMRSRWTGSGRLSAPLGSGTASWLDDGALTETEMLEGTCGPRCARLDLPVRGPAQFIGRPRLHLRATVDQPSTHLAATLVDVAADGSETVVTRGWLNARYRDGLEKGTDVPAGKPLDYTLELVDKDWVLADGHQLAVYLSSSSTDWVLSDERRANVSIDLAASSLELPVDGPEPAVAPPTTTAPAPTVTAPKRCRPRAVVRIPRGAKRIRINGRPARGRRIVVTAKRVKVTYRLRGRTVKRTIRGRC